MIPLLPPPLSTPNNQPLNFIRIIPSAGICLSGLILPFTAVLLQVLFKWRINAQGSHFVHHINSHLGNKRPANSFRREHRNNAKLEADPRPLVVQAGNWPWYSSSLPSPKPITHKGQGLPASPIDTPFPCWQFQLAGQRKMVEPDWSMGRSKMERKSLPGFPDQSQLGALLCNRDHPCRLSQLEPRISKTL